MPNCNNIVAQFCFVQPRSKQSVSDYTAKFCFCQDDKVKKILYILIERYEKGGAMMRVIYVENVNETNNRFNHKPCKNKAQEVEKKKTKKLLLSELETNEYG